MRETLDDVIVSSTCCIPDRNLNIRRSLHGVTVCVNLVHFTDVQLADTSFNFAHVTHHHPDEVARLNVLLGDLVCFVRRNGQHLLCVRVVVSSGRLYCKIVL